MEPADLCVVEICCRVGNFFSSSPSILTLGKNLVSQNEVLAMELANISFWTLEVFANGLSCF